MDGNTSALCFLSPVVSRPRAHMLGGAGAMDGAGRQQVHSLLPIRLALAFSLAALGSSHRREGPLRVAKPLYQGRRGRLRCAPLGRGHRGGRRDDASRPVQSLWEMGDDRFIESRFHVGL